MHAIFSRSRFIRSSVPSETGGRVESRCSRCVYTMPLCLLTLPDRRRFGDDFRRGAQRLNSTVAERVVIHAPLLHATNGTHQLLEIRLVLYRIDARRVDYQERSLV